MGCGRHQDRGTELWGGDDSALGMLNWGEQEPEVGLSAGRGWGLSSCVRKWACAGL